MKVYIIIPIILFMAITAEASENTMKGSTAQLYQECVAVSLYTMKGRELNSIVKGNRTLEKTNLIPDGWTVVGITTKSESDISNPYIVICH